MEAVNNPEDESAGTRTVPFTRELFIERDDFMEDPPRKFFRLAPGREVRLRYGYLITCDEVIKDEAGNVVELRCTYDPETRGGNTPDGRKVKATLHWVSATESLPSKVREYETLFLAENPDKAPEGRTGERTSTRIRSTSSPMRRSSRRWRALSAGTRFQFERLGYFCIDSRFDTQKTSSSTERSRCAMRGRTFRSEEITSDPRHMTPCTRSCNPSSTMPGCFPPAKLDMPDAVRNYARISER
jgi:glutaminyl-tRNA synthetase